MSVLGNQIRGLVQSPVDLPGGDRDYPGTEVTGASSSWVGTAQYRTLPVAVVIVVDRIRCFAGPAGITYLGQCAMTMII